MAKKAMDAAEAIISVPLGAAPKRNDYESQQVEEGRVTIEGHPPRMNIQAQLGQDAALAFIRIRNGLREQNAKLSNGRPVYSNADTLRWLMEQVANESG